MLTRSFCKVLLACWCMFHGSLLRAEEAGSAKGAASAAPAALAASDSSTAPAIGIDQPIVLPATSDEVTVRALLRLDAAPMQSDISAGLLTSTQQPNVLLRPSVTLLSTAPIPGQTGEFLAELKIQGLIVFGDSSAPLLYKGRQVGLLRFSKPGLSAKAAGEGGFVAREGAKLPLVLENPSGFEYKAVRARLRFVNQDVCAFDVEKFPGSTMASGKSSSAGNGCDSYESWTAFDLPRYAQVTLWTVPAGAWFLDPDTRLAHNGKQKGWLTLRFQATADGPIHEQNLPIEMDIVPGSGSLFRSLLWVALLLLAGAGLSLVLRVSVPNIKRRRQLKDQLNEAAKLTASISTEVDSNLRVLLRVERLALDEIRQAVWSFGPTYAEYAQRVEQGLPVLKRRIDAVRHLDIALIRKRLLMEQGAAPTWLEQIGTLLGTISEALKQDQLSEEDWVLVNQRLEAAKKLLREPTQTEKEAFEAMLAERWRKIRDHFGLNPDGSLKVPPVLRGMEACFPDPSLLPAPGDTDGSKWVHSVGTVRADLQLSALGLLWEFQFLAPESGTGRWVQAKETLSVLLATPAVDNLREAKSLLRQLAEGVAEEDIVAGLKRGHAMIVMDPAVPRPNQKIRFSVQFRLANLNCAAARELVACRWSFRDRHASSFQRVKRRFPKRVPQNGRNVDSGVTSLCEHGWYVHHYFESDAEESEISVNFYDSQGNPVDLGDAATSSWSRLVESVRPSRRSSEKWARAWLELFQLSAALLIPLATLAATTINGASAGHWWELVAIGFGSDTIKSILVGRQESSPSA